MSELYEISPDFGDPEPCAWCGDESHGVALDAGHWHPSCGDPSCAGPGGEYRGAR